MKLKTILGATMAVVALTGAVAAVAAPESSCSQKRVERSYQVNNFSGVDVANGIDVEYTVSDRLSATVEAPECIIDKVKLVQRGEMLNIYIDNRGGNLKRSGKVRVRLSSPLVNTFIASSGADIHCLGTIECGNRDCSVTVSSGADVDIAGVNCRNLGCSSSSGADIDIDALNAGVVNLSASSGGDIEVNGKMREVTATASSGADVKLKGECQKVNLTSSSAGEISAKGLSSQTGVANASSSGSIDCCVAGKFSQTTSSGGSVTNYN